MEQLYDPARAREIAKKTVNEEQTSVEQITALVDLPRDDLRQVLIAVMLGDI